MPYSRNMAESCRMLWLTLSVVLYVCGVTIAKEKAIPVQLTEETWQHMLKGEWMVKFYAPWCPACKALGSAWQSVAGWSEDLGIKVGQVDVTENPGLSGRFLVTSLPTIYHVKDGVFRTYTGSRTQEDIISFVDDQKWEKIDPLSWWISPSSPHMGVLSWFFKLSMFIRELHNTMTEQYGIPTWLSYAIFALSTIVVGLVLGIMIVFCCDVCFPPRPPPPYSHKVRSDGDSLEDDGDDSRDSDNIEDDRPGVGDQNNVRHRNPIPAD